MTEEHYKEAFSYIDNRWNCQLHHPLHAAGYFLNPSIYFDNKEVACCEKVRDGLITCMERLIREVKIQDKILLNLRKYKNVEGSFGSQTTIRQRKISPLAIKIS